MLAQTDLALFDKHPEQNAVFKLAPVLDNHTFATILAAGFHHASVSTEPVVALLLGFQVNVSPVANEMALP